MKGMEDGECAVNAEKARTNGREKGQETGAG